MDFVALDVETANADVSSICQIGIALFRNSCLVDELSELVNPKTYFDSMNTAIHGIEASDVLGAPSFSDLEPILRRCLGGETVVIHSHFDRVALSRACERHSLPDFDCEWLDTARVARR
ncbi:MAG: exonuclease domain-containing protein, partial [Pseudomonadota bacterium]